MERLLLDTSGYLEGSDAFAKLDGEISDKVRSARERLAEAGYPIPAVEAMARYGWVSQVLEGVVTRPAEKPLSGSDRIDRIVTHRFWGTAIFALLVLIVFQSIFSWAEPAMELIEVGFGRLGEVVSQFVPEGALRSLLIDGVVAGVGGVLVFCRRYSFCFFSLLCVEDCGYMARAAYLMDKLMSHVGLSGKSFIPLLSSFACAIPGIMAARVIENRRDRLVTILVAPLMSCSARLPVYVLLITTFFPDTEYLGGWLTLRGLTMFGMYLVGIVAAVLVAWLLSKSLLKAKTAVRDGTAQLQVAVGQKRDPASSGAGLVVCLSRRDVDLCRNDPGVGGGLFSPRPPGRGRRTRAICGENRRLGKLRLPLLPMKHSKAN